MGHRKSRNRDAFPEFGPATMDDDGRLTATHKPSGGTISAKTREELEHRAIGMRIGRSLRAAFDVPEQREQT